MFGAGLRMMSKKWSYFFFLFKKNKFSLFVSESLLSFCLFPDFTTFKKRIEILSKSFFYHLYVACLVFF